VQTLQFDLVSSSWTEILDGNNSLAIQLATASNIRLHFSNSGTAPDIDVASILVESFPPRWDFECQSQVGQARVWARADDYPASIVVVRRTA